jgi:hypothetical protein
VSPAGCSAIVARRNADFGFTDRIIYVIGLIVVIVFVLGFFGLR